MVMFDFSKQNFIKLLLVFSLLLACTVNIAQTKEQIDINSKSDELGITTTELTSIINSAISNGGSDDPLPEALTERFFTGQGAFDYFGYSVSSAGDVNGDGYCDIIIGAYANDAGWKIYL